MKQPLKVHRTANALLQNEINISIIFNFLRERGQTFRAEISRELGISAPAVSRAVEKLKDLGYVTEFGSVSTGNGRGKKAVPVSIDCSNGFVIGIDVIKDRLRMAAFDYSGGVVHRHQGFHVADSSDVADDLIGEINSFLQVTTRKIKGSLKAICLGVPAIVDEGSARLTAAVLFTNISSVDFPTVLGNQYHVPVFVKNNVQLAALSENKLGQGRHHKNLIFLEVSAGIGAGIIIDNLIYSGHGGAAGEIGYHAVNQHELGLGASDRGPMEYYASTDAIREAGMELLRQGVPTLIGERVAGNEERVTPHIVAECAMDGDLPAAEIMERVATRLSLACVSLSIILNPAVILFGGDLCSLPGFEELILEPIRDAVVSSVPFDPPAVEISSLNEDACVIGAGLYAIESLLRQEYPYQM